VSLVNSLQFILNISGTTRLFETNQKMATPRKLWVQVKSNIPDFVYFPTQVSTDDCEDIDDFVNIIKKKLAPDLDAFAIFRISICLAEDGPPLKRSLSLILMVSQPGFINNADSPLIVITLPPVVIHPPPVVHPPAVSPHSLALIERRYQAYKRMKGIESCRKFLTSVAVELSEIYPIQGFTQDPTSEAAEEWPRIITFADILREMWETNPEPKPEFRDRHTKRLKEVFEDVEWSVLTGLNDTINPAFPVELIPGKDGVSKEIMLPLPLSGHGPAFQRIAKKTNIVSELSHLVIKKEFYDL
jgi:hypothetical protein